MLYYTFSNMRNSERARERQRDREKERKREREGGEEKTAIP